MYMYPPHWYVRKTSVDAKTCATCSLDDRLTATSQRTLVETDRESLRQSITALYLNLIYLSL